MLLDNSRLQPTGLVRINPQHWLARDLVFAHTGRLPFIFGRPSPDPSPSALRGVHKGGTGAPVLNSTWGWVPDGTNYEAFALGIAALPLPVTLSAWWYGTSGATNDAIVAVARSAGQGGALLRRGTSENANVQTVDTSGTGESVGTTGSPYVSGEWMQGTAVIASNTSRTVYANGGYANTDTASNTFPTDCNEIRLAANIFTAKTPATTVLQGFALPLVISRALNADEVLRLYNEQATNPWELFAEKKIWVPVSGSRTIAVPAGSLSLTGNAPTVVATANQSIAVPAATLTLAGYAPTVVATAHQSIAVPAATLTLAGYAPTVVATGTTTIYFWKRTA